MSKQLKSGRDAKTDQLLLDIINHMPKWKTSLNANGVKVNRILYLVLARWLLTIKIIFLISYIIKYMNMTVNYHGLS